jgi:hypothetical protein
VGWVEVEVVQEGLVVGVREVVAVTWVLSSWVGVASWPWAWEVGLLVAEVRVEGVRARVEGRGLHQDDRASNTLQF